MGHSKEFDFYLKADLRKYSGKYVVIVDEKIVASGNTAHIWEKAQKDFPKKKSLLIKVPREETLILWT